MLRAACCVGAEQSAAESDYTTMFIPYGPKWTRERTRRLVDDYIATANSWYYRLNVSDPRADKVVCVCLVLVLVGFGCGLGLI